jgi:uncharacterized protein YraI
MLRKKIGTTILLSFIMGLQACTLPDYTPTPPPPATWQVAPDGDDSNDCRTRTTACLTVNGALAKAAPGETIQIAAGTYVNHAEAPQVANPVTIDKSINLVGSGADATVLDGGGITTVVLIYGPVEATLRDMTLTNGGYTPSSVPGGGLRVGNRETQVTLTNVIIRNNRAQNEAYGGAGILNLGDLALYNVQVEDNILDVSAPHTGQGMGGGIFNLGTLRMQGGTIRGNQVPAWRGGGLANGNHADKQASLFDVWIDDNMAGDFGGGILNNGGSMTIQRSTISHNRPEGIYHNGPGSLEIENSTVSGNLEAGIKASASFTLNFGTVSDNRFGIQWYPRGASDALDISNSIVAGNHDYSVNSHAYVWIRDHRFSGYHNLFDTSEVGSGPIATVSDAGLAPLGDYGGSTLTHALRPDSPAIDFAGSECPISDQRFRPRPRPLRGLCDSGAFEFDIEHDLIASSLPETVEFITATPQQPAGEVTLDKDANCRKGPGTRYNVVTSLVKGTTTSVDGRNEDNSWWYIQPSESGQACWVADSTVEKQGSPEGAPLMTGPDLPDPPEGFDANTACVVNPNQKGYTVTLRWLAVDGATGYRLYRNGRLLASVGGDAVSYKDGAPVGGKGFVYEIEAIGVDGVSIRTPLSVPACK